VGNPAMSATRGPIGVPQNNALHLTGREGAAVSLRRRPVVEARPAGERECSADAAK
jgi:hypothetical protein